jgi:hypothetical protein
VWTPDYSKLEQFCAACQTNEDTNLPVKWVRFSFLGAKMLRLGIDHPPPSSAEVKERVEVYLYSLSGPSLSITFYIFILYKPSRAIAGAFPQHRTAHCKLLY